MKRNSTPDTANKSVYCLTSALRGSVRTRRRSDSVKVESEATTGKRPINLRGRGAGGSDFTLGQPRRSCIHGKNDSLWDEAISDEVTRFDLIEQCGFLLRLHCRSVVLAAGRRAGDFDRLVKVRLDSSRESD